MITYLVKVFDGKNKHLDTLEVDNKKPITKSEERELIGYCRIFVNPKSRLLEITKK